MNKARTSNALKIVCYILIPILFAILILSILHMSFLSEFGNKKDETEYMQTENFANNYLYFLINKVNDCQTRRRENVFEQLKDEQGELFCYFDGENRNKGIGTYIQYIIIERATGEKFTNIRSSNYNEVIQNTKNKNTYWNYIEGKVETSLTYINDDNIKYNYYFNHVNYTNDKDETKYLKDYDIYSFYDENSTTIISSFLFNKNIYDFMLQNKAFPLYSCIFSIILLIIIAFYLFWSIGYKKGKKEISINTLDRVPYEIISIICFFVIIIALEILIHSLNTNLQYLAISMAIISYLAAYIACAIYGITTIKRIKANTFWKSFLIYRLTKWTYKKMGIYVDEINRKTPETKKVFWYYLAFVLISIILACVMGSVISIIALILFWIWVYYQLRKYVRKQEEIKETLEKIYQGNSEVYLDTSELQGTLKEMAVYINDIAGGFSNAIEESLKSERLKTELITNVSHDIKTPLTSIINYVDLLKKEDLQNEKVKEYVEILDRKSQRLKKLTEDLVEASKVSSGNVQLNIEEIKLKELINQSIGEFKDRFEEKGLKIETNMLEEDVKIKADNRYLYRVIENLFSNVTKYALENSRVYIDMKQEKNKIEISIKNISKERLNISSEELMQRFVRGDKSRYTEGSGLGLSIAKSLIELQGGKFDIFIDGDLFKVVMQW